MPFDTADDTHKLNLLPLALLTLVQVILYVGKWSRTARRTEPRVLHCGNELEVVGVNEVYCISIKGNPL